MSKCEREIYSPISVINCEQLMISGNPRHTNFSFEMYKNFRDSSYEKNIMILMNIGKDIVPDINLKKLLQVIYF